MFSDLARHVDLSYSRLSGANSQHLTIVCLKLRVSDFLEMLIRTEPPKVNNIIL